MYSLRRKRGCLRSTTKESVGREAGGGGGGAGRNCLKKLRVQPSEGTRRVSRMSFFRFLRAQESLRAGFTVRKLRTYFFSTFLRLFRLNSGRKVGRVEMKRSLLLGEIGRQFGAFGITGLQHCSIALSMSRLHPATIASHFSHERI